MTLHPIFTPRALSGAELERITVGRADLIQRLVDRLSAAATSASRAHTLVIGARGSGKTHLLALSLHRARLEQSVADRLAVAWLPEDAFGIGSYVDLLSELLRQLDPNRSPDIAAARRAKDARSVEQVIDEVVDDRALVIVIENLDRVFQSLGRSGASALRGYVETGSNALVMATSPLLFSAVSKRDEPWYGSFDAEYLKDLTLSEGTQIVQRRARDRGDDDLSDFVRATRGQDRLRAVEHLAGGSPRLWHILAEAVTIDSLEKLLPAVKKLLDDLAPYYQQRMWDLGGAEQKLVLELARAGGAVTVKSLAEEAGLEERATATSLGRLTDTGWVRASKMEGTDKRLTWYELREPLLRHHLQYRENRGETLQFIVDVLRAWYSDGERASLLRSARPDSRIEKALALTFRTTSPLRSDLAWARRDWRDMRQAAVLWANGTATGTVLASPDLGRAIRDNVDDARQFTEDDERVSNAIGLALVRLSRDDWAQPSDQAIIRCAEASWQARIDPAEAISKLARALRLPVEPPLRLVLRAEHAYWTGVDGAVTTARDEFDRLVTECTGLVGPDHADTMASRAQQAHWTGEAGEDATARDLYAALLPDLTRVLRPGHPDTLAARHHHACWTGWAGDAARAKDLFQALVRDTARWVNGDDPLALATRGMYAYWTGEAGDPVAARNLVAALIPDLERLHGPDHVVTLSGRRNHAWWTEHAGDPETALGLLEALVPDLERVHGAHAFEYLSAKWETERLVQELRAETTRRLLVLGPAADHQGWLTANGALWLRGDPVLTTLAKGLDGDAAALARTPEELRRIVLDQRRHAQVS
ncbi:MAG TPA: BREX system ATP-binding domain-containing protein [Dermatophilaceae bacterium]|nr:BREX system ATP-binding domain-containing protein [Dermatophilaceae bacterium]